MKPKRHRKYLEMETIQVLKKRNQNCISDEETMKVNHNDGTIKTNGDKVFIQGKSFIIHSYNIPYYKTYLSSSRGCSTSPVSTKAPRHTPHFVYEQCGPPRKV
jgi:hypothetical protein